MKKLTIKLFGTVRYRWMILLAVLFLTSCKMLPEIERVLEEVMTAPFRNSQPAGSRSEASSSRTAEPPAAEEASVYFPAEEPVMAQEPAVTVDAVPDITEVDSPETAPDEAVDPLLPVPEVPESPQTPEAPEPPPPEPPPPEPPPQAQQQAVEQPQIARAAPPPAPPATVRPSQPVPPPQAERETPAVPVPDMPFQPASVIPQPSEEDLPYSRTVAAQTGQYIDIPFRGSGWVYLGEFGSRRGVSYESRQMEEEGMTFVFRAVEEGTYSLRFNRQDFVRDTVLNDYVKVIVEQAPPFTRSSLSNAQVRPERVSVQRWPLAADPAGNIRPAAQAETAVQPAGAELANQTELTNQADLSSEVALSGQVQPAAVVPEPVPEDWLARAREEYNAGRIPGALSALDQFMIRFPTGSDEAYWLYGQSLEANNETTRDIRLALDYYRRLTRDFPQSDRYDDAHRRIVYLERFYFNIQ